MNEVLPRTKHILVVEDEEHLAVGIQYNLHAEGYRVTSVDDGQQALKLIEENPSDVDLMVLDLMLPGMSGYAVCEKLRESGLQMPILILSARTLAEDRTRGFQAGANQYMMKPFDLEEFLSRIRNLLAMAARPAEALPGRSAADAAFCFGTAQINFATHEVRVAGQPVRMTRLELKLLQHFIENAGRVIPREELLEKVWEMPGGLNTRAPDQFIRRLRKVFEPNPAEPRHFLTIRDVGYRFVPEPPEA